MLFSVNKVSDTRGMFLHHSPGFYLFKSTMGKREFEAHTLNELLEINAISLIMATHAAPAVQGVTRAGLGIISELISLSVHELHEVGQLVSQSERVKIRIQPPLQTKCTGGQGLPPVCVPLPVGLPLFEIREKERSL